MIRAHKLSIAYKRDLFKEVSFILGNRERVGLVGLNGSGKSTLIKILAGEEKPDSGHFEISSHESIGYLPQEFSLSKEFATSHHQESDSEVLVGEFLEDLVDDHLSEFWKVEKILSKLSLQVDHFTSIESLSPGQKMKLYLTKILISEPTILLIDEPTNHLDIEGIAWFESFVKKFDGIVIVISHDRAFLNNVTTHIFEIDEKTLHVWTGNYDDYLQQKEDYKEERAMLFKAQERKRAQLEQLLTNARKLKDAKQRGKAVKAAKKRMEREVTRHEISDYDEEKVGDINIDGDVRRTKLILEIEDLDFSYDGETKIIDQLNYELFGNQKVWILGANGTGKSTLIKLLVNELVPDSGKIKWGENLNWMYFSQSQDHLPFDERVDDYFLRETNCSFGQSFGVLEKFLFDKSYRDQKIGTLSPGQRARLSFAIFAQKEYDCLLLDEPTNHLDIKTKEVVEKSIREFRGAVIYISHDRYFAENIFPDQVITLENGKIVEI